MLGIRRDRAEVELRLGASLHRAEVGAGPQQWGGKSWLGKESFKMKIQAEGDAVKQPLGEILAERVDS